MIQVNTAPNAPNHTFPDGKPNTSSFLADYQAYYFQFQAGGQQYYWVLAPYAITFTLPGNDPKQYSFTIREQKTITAGTNQPVKLPLQTVYLDEKAMDPTKANIGKDGSASILGTSNSAGRRAAGGAGRIDGHSIVPRPNERVFQGGGNVAGYRHERSWCVPEVGLHAFADVWGRSATSF